MKKKDFNKLKFTLITFFSFSIFNCYATNFYVSTNGNNSNTGTFLLPFATIDYAVNNKMSPGDVLFVRGGVYKFSTYLSKSGSTNALITVKNYTGEMPELNGWSTTGTMSTGNGFGNANGVFLSNIRIEGFYITGFYRGIGFNWCDPCNSSLSNGNQTQNNPSNSKGTNIQVVYNVVDGCGQNGISVNFTSNLVIERNVVSRTGYEIASTSWSSGISLLGISGYNRVDSNVSFHHIDVSSNNTDGNGIIIDLSYDGINNDANTQVTNNICFNNGGSGIQVTRSSKVTAVNNSTYNNVQKLSSFWGEFTVAGTNAYHPNNIQLVNNILYPKSGGNSIGIDGNFPNQISANVNNLLGLTGEIQYKNAQARDFSLKTAQSTAIDKGNDNYTFLTNDNGYALTDILVAGVDAGSPSWYTHRPNVAFIKSKGGLSGCFVTHARKQLVKTDIGAIESPINDTSLTDDSFQIDPNSERTKITILPNPFENVFNIQINKKIIASDVSIYNILGKSQQFTLENNDDNSYRVNTSNLASGVYFLKIKTEDKQRTLKIVKK
jgi:hypothetical protein